MITVTYRTSNDYPSITTVFCDHLIFEKMLVHIVNPLVAWEGKEGDFPSVPRRYIYGKPSISIPKSAVKYINGVKKH